MLWPAGARSGSPVDAQLDHETASADGGEAVGREPLDRQRRRLAGVPGGDELAGRRREADAGALVAGGHAEVRRLRERADDRHVVGRQRAQAGVHPQRAGVVQDREEARGAAGDRARRPTRSTSRSKPTCWRLEPSSAVPLTVDSTTMAICSAAWSASTAAT